MPHSIHACWGGRERESSRHANAAMRAVRAPNHRFGTPMLGRAIFHHITCHHDNHWSARGHAVVARRCCITMAPQRITRLNHWLATMRPCLPLIRALQRRGWHPSHDGHEWHAFGSHQHWFRPESHNRPTVFCITKEVGAQRSRVLLNKHPLSLRSRIPAHQATAIALLPLPCSTSTRYRFAPASPLNEHTGARCSRFPAQ